MTWLASLSTTASQPRPTARPFLIPDTASPSTPGAILAAFWIVKTTPTSGFFLSLKIAVFEQNFQKNRPLQDKGGANYNKTLIKIALPIFGGCCAADLRRNGGKHDAGAAAGGIWLSVAETHLETAQDANFRCEEIVCFRQ